MCACSRITVTNATEEDRVLHTGGAKGERPAACVRTCVRRDGPVLLHTLEKEGKRVTDVVRAELVVRRHDKNCAELIPAFADS